MPSLVSVLLECICIPIPTEEHRSTQHVEPSTQKPNYGITTKEKANPICKTTTQVANEIIALLQSSEKSGAQLRASVDQIAAQAGSWSESIARYILTALENLLKEGRKVDWGQAMQEAYQKASDTVHEVADFAEAHPVLCTVIAFGILVILAPAVLNALGFGALGPVEGSFAALWQSMYGGFVEQGSLFSWLQRLGMLY